MQWFADAPANIALIKYMGKKDAAKNLPDNPSLSYTLNNLLTYVTLELHSGTTDVWESLDIPGADKLNLSTTAQARFLHHLSRMKALFNYNGNFIVRSNNTFPHGSGLASSASSFAALTKCASLALSELTHSALPSVETQADLSRQGSGSSCRSFFSPWAVWNEERVEPIALPYETLSHEVIVIDRTEKNVSSSEAHRRIRSSQLYADRSLRATKNLASLLAAFRAQNWHDAYQICWQEFQDMHALFSSCDEPFSYMTTATCKVLEQLQTFWHEEEDGPIVTMDAGPNIHLLYRLDQGELAYRFKQKYLMGQYDVI